MKKLIIIIVLLLSVNLFSQTTTEKWNTLYGRYEYFNSSGTMIGYKKYDSLRDRWEYYDLRTTNNNSNSGYQIQQPVSFGDLELVNKVLSSKQAKYDYNLKRIEIYISECRNLLNSSDMDATLIQNIKDYFNTNYLRPIYNKGYDFSSDSTTNKIIDWLNEGLITTIKNESEKFNTSNKPTDLKSIVGGYTVPVLEEQMLQTILGLLPKKKLGMPICFLIVSFCGLSVVKTDGELEN